MLYDEYSKKIDSLANILVKVVKFRFLIYAIIALILTTIGVLLGIKGISTSPVYCSDAVTYGEAQNFSSSAIMSDVYFEFREKNSSTWTTEVPTKAGEYEVRSVSERSFGLKGYSEISTFVINKRELDMDLLTNTIAYGTNPQLVYELVEGDSISTVEFNYEPKNTTRSMISLKSITIINENGEDVTDSYDVKFEEQEIIFGHIALVITTASETKVYDGLPLVSNNYTLSSTLLEGYNLNIPSEAYINSITNVGSISNSLDESMISVTDSNNLNFNELFDLSYNYGTLTVTKRAITITSASTTFTYDSLNHSDTTFTYENEELVEGHRIEVVSSNEYSVVGTFTNELDYKIYNGDEDVTENYEITKVSGTITITKADLNVSIIGSKVFDNIELELADLTTTLTGLVNQNHYYLFNSDSLNRVMLNAGTYNDLAIIIYDENNYDITSNYNLIYTRDVEITKRQVTINVTGEMTYSSKVFEERYLEYTYALESLELVSNHEFEFTILNNNYITPNTYNNIELGINIENNNDNYDITYTANITILQQDITINLEGYKIYDGTNITSEDVIITRPDELIEGHIINVVYNDIINVGSYDKEDITLTILEGETDVTANYNILDIIAILTVNKRVVNITFTGEKVYDGLAYNKDDFILIYNTSLEIAENQTLVYSINDNQNYINASDYAYEPVLSIDIIDNNDNSVYDNYEFGYYATITINRRDVSITLAGGKVYDNIAYEASSLTPTYENDTPYELLENHTFNFAFNEDTRIINAGTYYNVFVNISITDTTLVEQTSNYNINCVSVTIEISKRTISLTGTYTKIFDGLAVDANDIEFNYVTDSLEFIEGHNLYAIINRDIINVNTYTLEDDISFTFSVIDNEYIDQTNNYDITVTELEIVITQRVIILEITGVKTYDGYRFAENLLTYEVTSELKLVSGHYITFTINEDYINANTYNDANISIEIYTEDISQTSNYSITSTRTITINKRFIEILVTGSKIYDGLSITEIENVNTEFITGSLVNTDTINHEISYLVSENDYINAGLYENIAHDVTIMDNDSNVTVNYDIASTMNITINRRDVEISVTGTKVYDGYAYSLDNQLDILTTSELDIISGHSFTKEILATFINAGIVSGSINDGFLNFGIINTTSQESEINNYNLTGTYRLEIEQRLINISIVGSKVYDGTRLNESSLTITDISNSLLTNFNHEIVVYINDFINVKDSKDGQLPDVDYITVDIMAGETSVTANYEITGTYDIDILHREITLSVTGTKEYDAILFEDYRLNYEYTNSANELVNGHSISFIILNNEFINVVENIEVSLVETILDSSNIDVTENYIVNYETSTISITKRIIEVVVTGSKIYDGLSITEIDNLFTLFINGSLVNTDTINHEISYLVNENNYINAGLYENIVHDVTIMDNNSNVTDNYDIASTMNITINRRDVEISVTGTKVYDGLAYSLDNQLDILTISELDIISGHSFTKEILDTFINAGIVSGSINDGFLNFSIINTTSQESEINNYNLTGTYTLEIEKRLVNISLTGTKVYDGTKLDKEDLSIAYLPNSLELVLNHQFSIVSIPDIINVRDYDTGIIENNNDIIIDIIASNVSYKDNYEIMGTYEFSITPRAITVNVTGEKTYDAIAYIADDLSWEVTSSLGLVNGHDIILTINQEYINAFVYNDADILIEITDGIDTLNENYSITSTRTITINKRSLVLEITGSKIYDGESIRFITNLTPNCIEDTSLINNGTIIHEFRSISIAINNHTNVGTYTLYHTVQIIDNNSTDVTENYEIDSTMTIVINPRPINIQVIGSKVYDGTRLEEKDLTIIHLENSLSVVAGHNISIISIPNYINVLDTDNGNLDDILIEIDILASDSSVKTNYTISGSYDFEITKRVISINLYGEKYYDGESLVLGDIKTTILENSLIPVLNHNIKVLNIPNIINVNESCKGNIIENNDIKTDIFDSNETSVLDNYEIIGTYEFIIKPLEINLTVTGTQVYDGYAFDGELVYEYINSTHKMLDNHKISFAINDNNYIDVVENQAVTLTARIVDGTGTNVTGNYIVTYESAIITITPLKVSISGSGTQEYNDKPFDSKNINYESNNNIVAGHRFVTDIINNEYIDADTYKFNEEEAKTNFTVRILDSLNNDKTSNYDITITDMTLTITKKVINVNISETKVYDDKPFDVSTLEDIYNGGLVEGHELKLTFTEIDFVDVGTFNPEVTIEIVSGDISKSKNYDIRTGTIQFKITQRPITITSDSKEFKYDGEIHFHNSFTNESYNSESNRGLLEGFTIRSSINSSITNVGKISNILRYIIVKGDVDKTTNYSINNIYGTLEVTPRIINLEELSASKVFDNSNSFTFTYLNDGTNLVLDHQLVITVVLNSKYVGTYTSDDITSETYEVRSPSTGNVKNNYQINYTIGNLTIEKFALNITIEGSKDYDGTKLEDTDYTVTSNLPDEFGFNLKVNLLESYINAGTYTNTNDFEVSIEENGNNINGQFNINITKVLLTINKCILTYTVDATKDYDGEYFDITNSINLINNSIFNVNNETMTLSFIYNVNTPGVYKEYDESKLDYKITVGTTDVTSNYVIEFDSFSLTINNMKLLININTTKEYTGSAINSLDYTIVSGSLVAGHKLTINSTLVDIGTYTKLNYLDGIYPIKLVFTSTDNNTYDYDKLYDIEYSNFNVEITPVALDVLANPTSNTHTYDGEEKGIYLSASKLLTGHQLVYTTSVLATDPGTYRGSITTLTIEDVDGNNVSSLYDITYPEEVILIISKIYVSISSTSETKLYDGKPLTNDTITLTGNLLDGVEVTYSNFASITNAGSIQNTFDYTFTKDGVEYTDFANYYSIAKRYGTLTVNRAVIEYTGSKTYDGYTFDVNNLELISEENSNHIVTITRKVDIINVGSYNINDFNVLITDSDNYVIYNSEDSDDYNYSVTINVTIYIRSFGITTDSLEATYDGLEHSISSYKITTGSLAETDKLINITTRSYVTAGTHLNTLNGEYDIVNILTGESQLTNYSNIILTPGNIVINPREVTVVSNSYTVKYGEEFNEQSYNYKEGSLEFIPTDTVTASYSNYLDLIAEGLNVENRFKLEFTSEEITKSYKVNYEYGKVTVEKREISIRINDASKYYDGILLTCNKFDILTGELYSDDILTITTTGGITQVGSTTNGLKDFTVSRETSTIIVTKYYNVTCSETSKLEVKAQIDLSIKNQTINQVYNGTTLNDITSVINNISGLEDNDEITGLSIEYYKLLGEGRREEVSSINSTGEFMYRITSVIVVDENGERVDANKYRLPISYLECYITITKRNITIESPTIYVIYGEIVDNSGYIISGNGLVTGHTYQVSNDFNINTSNIEFEGTFNNTFDVKIYDESGNDVSDNYNITKVYGKIEIYA